jgi:L-amino acid N-acyltransferase YncA
MTEPAADTTVRVADPARDAAACAAIYAPFVSGTAVTFEEDPPPAEADFAARIANAHLWLVAERGGEVAGYAYASQHHARASYRWAADVAVYVGDGQRGRGLGRALYAPLLDELRERGYWVAVAGVTLPNDASVGLHRAFGFTPVGTYERIGWKAGAWHDVAWWQLALRPGDDGPPAEPR